MSQKIVFQFSVILIFSGIRVISFITKNTTAPIIAKNNVVLTIGNFFNHIDIKSAGIENNAPISTGNNETKKKKNSSLL